MSRFAIRSLLRFSLGLSALLGLPAVTIGLVGSAHADTVVVTLGDPNWEISNFDNTTQTATGAVPTTSGTNGEFVFGPATPPAGDGSFRQMIGTDGDDGQRLRTSLFNGMLLSDITTLSYWTYVASPSSTGQATYIQLFLDNGDILFFEPAYQNGTYSGDPVPNQGNQQNLVWQQWDAAAGGWWSLNASTFGPPLVTLANYAAANPGVRLTTTTTAFRLTAGFGSAAWPGFDGNFDAVQVNATLYDMEPLGSTPVRSTTLGRLKNLYR